MATTQDTCLIFFDDSNIWIEAQKFAASGNSHMPKLKSRDSDPRLRINIGNMISTMLCGRWLGESYLYGSRPPPNDTVWKMFERKGFHARIFDRVCGKEKEVDTSMTRDIVRCACQLPNAQKDHTVFVVVSGDRDMKPGVCEALDNGIHVELWAWQDNISKEYYRMQQDDSRLTVQLFNTIFKQISFTNYRSTHKDHQVDPRVTVAFCDLMDPSGDYLEDSTLEEYVANRLLQLGHEFYTTVPPGLEASELLVEFPNIRNLDFMFVRLRKMFGDILTLYSWPEYHTRNDPQLMSLARTSTRYQLLEEAKTEAVPEEKTAAGVAPWASTTTTTTTATATATGDDTDATDSEDATDPDGGWQEVMRSNPKKKHGHHLRKTQPCPRGIRCRDNGKCGYRHTEREQQLFHTNPNRNFAMWKTRWCTKQLPHAVSSCPFAHNEAEAWCLHCHVEKHLLDTCPYKNLQAARSK